MMRKMGKSMCLLLALLILMGVLLVSCGEAATPTDEPASSDGNDSPTTTEPTGEVVINSMKKTYETALSCLEQGKIEEAYALFLSIPDYRDVSEHLACFVYRHGKKVTRSSSLGNIVDYRYNQYGQEIEWRNGNKIGNRLYDDKGNLLYEIFETGDKNTYTYDESGLLIKRETHRAHDGKISESERYFYNEKGQKIKLVREIGSDGRYVYEFHYEYDEKGNRIRATNYFNGEMEGVTVFSYDTAGNLISEIITTLEGKWYGHKYEYNEHHLLISQTYSSSVYGVIDTVTMEYDANGNLVRRVYAYKNEYVEESLYEYDGAGQKIKHSRKWNSVLTGVETYEYDKRGILNRHMAHSYNEDGSIASYSVVDYLDYQLYYNPFDVFETVAEDFFGGK